MRATLIALTASLGLALTGALVVPAVEADDGVTFERSHSCRNVVVQFGPSHSGGAMKIKVKRIGCDSARNVVRKCIKGELKPGWSVKYVDLKFRLKKGDKRIRYVPVSSGGCLPVSRTGGPAPPDGADRIESFKLNLDGDDAKERVLVYNLLKPGSQPGYGAPVSWFEVWNRKQGDWKLTQRELVYLNPGSEEAGLVEAWVSDLNRDGRVEIAVRDFVSPSFGETLSIYRQKSETSKKFEGLQNVGGDRVKVAKKKGEAAKLKVYLSSGHSPDGIEHHEIWKWSDMADRWTCRKDCATRVAGRAR